MIRNYLTIAWRSVLRNKLYSTINVLGLSIGISACLIIFLIVRFELSFDRFHPDRDRIYRVYSRFSGDYNGVNHGVCTGMSVAVKNELTGVESQTAFHTYNAAVTIPEKDGQLRKFEDQKDIILAGPEYFKVFMSYEWIVGSPAALANPFQVVLTESKARKYFGEGKFNELIGRDVHYRDSLVVSVAGIVHDIPHNTDFDFGDFISFATIEKSFLKGGIQADDWTGTSSSSQFFIKLLPGVQAAELGKRIQEIGEAHKPKDEDPNWKVSYPLQPLADLHYNSEIQIFDSSRSAAHLPTLQILVVIACLLLVIAAINFINLETAQAMRRAKEVGLRKVMGSSRLRLILHFLMQSVLLTGFAVALSLPLSHFALKFFTDFIPSGVGLNLSDPFTLGFLFISVAVVSFLAGFYPAFSLSSFLPVQALKNQIPGTHKTRGGVVRKTLIIFQFTFAQVLIVATLIAASQIRYMVNKDLGFNKEAIVYAKFPWWEGVSGHQVVKNEMERIPEIEGITLCDDVPASGSLNSSTFKFNNGKEELHHNVYRKFGDTAYVHVFDLKLLAGRNLHKSDSVSEFIINETYARELGFRNYEEALGKMVTMSGKNYPIVGVVKDFNFESLRTSVKPVVIADNGNRFWCLGMRLGKVSASGLKPVLDKMEEAWKKAYPEDKFEPRFLDETIAKFYEKEQRTSKLVNAATAVAILISCMGLFGLASFTAAQRTKEIGIRKVLGATVNNIVGLLSKEFLKLVVIAFVIAAPLAYYVSTLWLADFAYRIAIGWSVFAWTILASLFIAVMSVSYQSLRAAMADPAESLRYE